MKIKLHNRDRANLWLEKIKDTEDSGISEWELKVDPNHEYCLKFMRLIGNYPEIDAIDPSGGPFLAVADELEGKYKIIKFINATTVLISERNNN